MMRNRFLIPPPSRHRPAGSVLAMVMRDATRMPPVFHEPEEVAASGR